MPTSGAPGIRIRRERAASALSAAAVTAIGVGTKSPKITSYFGSTGYYPSNAQVSSVGKDGSGNFSSSVLNNIDFGNSIAPKGHFILEVFNRDYSSVSAIYVGVLQDLREIDTSRPSTVCSAFGRIWYSGTSDSATQGMVFFSQIAGTIDGYEKCYQQNDPTSEDNPDLLDTDGGIIPIQNAGTVVGLVEAFAGILVLCANGVWYISGTEQIGFTATGYQIQKVSDVGCISRDSIVFAEGNVFYWSDAGIYAVSQQQQGVPVAVSISQSSIQNTYNAISDTEKLRCEGIYSSRDKHIIWAYGEGQKKTSFLQYSLELNAFIPYATVAVSPTNDYPVSVAAKGYFTSADINSNVLNSSGVLITDSAGSPVYITTTLQADAQSTIKVLSVMQRGSAWTVQFSEFNNEDHLDWGVQTYLSYAESGAITGGDLMRNKQAAYIVNHFERTEDGYELDANSNIVLTNQSGCFVRSKWDWTSTSSAGKWSNSQQAYRLKHLYIPLSVADPFDYSYDVATSKIMLRGNGYSFRLRYESDGNKHFKLLGFGLPVTSETVV